MISNRFILPLILIFLTKAYSFAAINVTVELISSVTSCTSPNGKAKATVNGVTEGYTFSWYCNGSTEEPTCYTGSEFSGMDYGLYYVVATDNNTAEFSAPQAIVIPDVKEFPNPTISLEGNVLYAISDFASVYKWFFNEEEIPNTNNSELAITEPGDYQVEVISELGCSGLSGVFTAVVTALNSSTLSANDKVYPNPANNYIIISADEDILKSNLIIQDLDGKTVFRKSISQQGDYVDISNLPAGVYIVTLVDSKQVKTKQRLSKF